MPYDQVKHPKLDVSGSEPIRKPAKAPPPPPNEFTVQDGDDSIVKLAYDLNAKKEKLAESRMV